MGRRPRRDPARGGEEAGLSTTYEGPEVLTALLARAGSPLGAEEVAERFRTARAAGEERSDVIPTLFPDEPRFASPDEARRLYGNLFALWQRVASGLSADDDAPAVSSGPPARSPPPPLPARGSLRGTQLTPALVEAVWKHLDALPGRDRRRLRDRFEGAQPNVLAWLEALPLADEGAIAAQELAFETWAMFDVGFGDRLQRVEFRELRALEAEPLALEASQPALARYVAEALDLAADEAPSFGAAQRAQVERTVATVADSLADALAPEEDA